MGFDSDNASSCCNVLTIWSFGIGFSSISQWRWRSDIASIKVMRRMARMALNILSDTTRVEERVDGDGAEDEDEEEEDEEEEDDRYVRLGCEGEADDFATYRRFLEDSNTVTCFSFGVVVVFVVVVIVVEAGSSSSTSINGPEWSSLDRNERRFVSSVSRWKIRGFDTSTSLRLCSMWRSGSTSFPPSCSNMSKMVGLGWFGSNKLASF